MKIRKSVAAAGAAATLAAASGLLAVPAFASDASGMHTLHFIAHPVAMHSFGRTGGTEIDKDTSGGKVVAYDILDFVSANGADVALALNHGFLYGKFTESKMGAITGKITGGTAAYMGDMGTIMGQAMKKGAKVTVTYHH
jgi:hypothetical protein